MTSLLQLAATAAPEGGLFDLDATLPLMAVQVVVLTYTLNALFFRPVGRAVEEREGYVATSRAEAKRKLAEVERLEVELTKRLRGARQQSQAFILKAEQEMGRLYRDALAEATAETNATREKARKEIEAQRLEAVKALDADVDQMSSMIIDRLLAV